MIDLLTKYVKARCEIAERDVGEYAVIKKSGKKFLVHSFEAVGLGRFSSVSMTAMLGLMKMETVVFTPLTKGMPLLSFDRINAMGNDILLLELYDTGVGMPPDLSALDAVKASAKDLPDHDLGTHWYDPMKLSPSLAKKSKKCSEAYRDVCDRYFAAYFAAMDGAKPCTPEEARQGVAAYVNGLFENGGPSTDQFKKMLGEKAARELFDSYIFSGKG